MRNAVIRQEARAAVTAPTVDDVSPADSSLVWQGDDIGLAVDRDATVILRDPAMPGGVWHISLADALNVVDRLDSYGRERIELALCHAAEHGHLSVGDMAVWEEYVTHGKAQWVPVIHVRRDDGEQSHADAVSGDPQLSHSAALNAARSMCDALGGEWYGVRRATERGAM
ncbi:hypothetical protein [Burkholderia ubonensis]|uniref:hypothetical protein n=1 Tax=Burkholderia ubonensis TaxID=101571 RepID=UPI000AFDFEA7|nr:hypothetical protein [Burkholderia ubonensis]